MLKILTSFSTPQEKEIHFKTILGLLTVHHQVVLHNLRKTEKCHQKDSSFNLLILLLQLLLLSLPNYLANSVFTQLSSI